MGSVRPNGGNAATEEDLELEEELAYTAAHVTSVLKPVSVTMVLVVLIIKATQNGLLSDGAIQSPYLVYRESASDDTGERMGKAIVNALVIVGMILVFTVFFFFLYKWRCMKVRNLPLCVCLRLSVCPSTI
jgi:hypothetical protein